MDFKTLIDTFNKLKELLQVKRETIIKKELEKLNETDEQIRELSEFLVKNNYSEIVKTFGAEEKKQIKEAAEEIKNLEKNNEILIKHSLDVINGLLSGILNIASIENCSYDAKGKNRVEQDPYRISSITEEA